MYVPRRPTPPSSQKSGQAQRSPALVPCFRRGAPPQPDTSDHYIKKLLEFGCKKQKLRAHSDFFPNLAVNEWALSFGEYFDIQAEAKGKNLASQQLYDLFISTK